MLRPFSEKGPFNLVDPWVIFGKESRVVTIFTPILSSKDVIVAEGSTPVSIAEQIYGSLIKLGQESNHPVKIVINSPGGNIIPGFTIIQAIEHLKKKGITVATLNLCEAMSMAGVILMMGTRGYRYALGDTLTLTHFGERHFGGRTAEDVQEMTKHVDRINERLYELISENSNIPEFHLKRSELPTMPDLDLKNDKNLRNKLTRQFLGQNVLMSPEEAVSAGIVDKVLVPGDPIIDWIFGSEGGR